MYCVDCEKSFKVSDENLCPNCKSPNIIDAKTWAFINSIVEDLHDYGFGKIS